MKDEFDASIDELNLWGEWMNQAARYKRYAEIAAEAREDYDIAKDELALEKARLQLDIASKPDVYGLPKVTESIMQAAIIAQPSYQTKAQEVIAARKRLGVVEAAVISLDHRKKALENAVTMEINGLRADPKALKADREIVNDKRKEIVRRKTKQRSKSNNQ